MKELLFLHSGSIASALSPVQGWSSTQLWSLNVTQIPNKTRILNSQICFHKIAVHLLSTHFRGSIVQLLNIHRKGLWSSPNSFFNWSECFSTLSCPAYSWTVRWRATLPRSPNFHWVSGMCSCSTTTYICFSWTRQQSLGLKAGEGAVWVEFPKFCCLQVQWAVGAGLSVLPKERHELPKTRYLTRQSTFCLLPCPQRELKEPAGNWHLILKETWVRGWTLIYAWLALRAEQTVSSIQTAAWFGCCFHFSVCLLMRRYQRCNACVS